MTLMNEFMKTDEHGSPMPCMYRLKFPGSNIEHSFYTERTYLELKATLEFQRDHAKREANELRKQIPCATRGYFRACPNCEPVMCCSGQECGCQGMPVDFKPTEKCENDCVLKLHQLLKDIHEQLECPARNTTITSHRRDGSVIISHDLRSRVKQIVQPIDDSKTQ
jgi:hypothetical protein